MVRTKADRVLVRAVGSKAPHKSVNTTPKKGAGGSKGKSSGGGNPYHPRETPEWQKPITCFLNQNPGTSAATGPSSSKENCDPNEIEETVNTDENDGEDCKE